jgi:hypothetical protein
MDVETKSTAEGAPPKTVYSMIIEILFRLLKATTKNTKLQRICLIRIKELIKQVDFKDQCDKMA